jgi:hypothetical protein
MGDMPGALFAAEAGLEWSKSGVHWDWTISQPTVVLDDWVLAKDGQLHFPHD